MNRRLLIGLLASGLLAALAVGMVVGVFLDRQVLAALVPLWSHPRGASSNSRLA